MTDTSGREATPKELCELFRETYVVEAPLEPGAYPDTAAVVDALARTGHTVDVLELVEDGTAG